MIVADRIEKSFHGERVLRDVSLTVEDGEHLTVMGESGSGKSTLLSILGGFLIPDGGSVSLNGVPLSSYTAEQMAALRSRELGFVFQSFRLIPTLTARDNILLPATLGGRRREELAPYFGELTEELGLSALLSKYPEELSGGQCQRVAIARALLYRPHTVILDEPTGALDSETEGRVMRLLGGLCTACGTTLVVVTHSARVATFAHRVLHLVDGVLSE